MRKSKNNQVFSALEEAIKIHSVLKGIGCFKYVDSGLTSVKLVKIGKDGFRLLDSNGKIIVETHNDNDDMVKMLTELLTGFLLYEDMLRKSGFIEKITT